MLQAPGPDRDTLLRLLRSAVRVPDHGKREPFRFLRLAGPARAELGQALAEITLRRDPDALAAAEKDRLRFTHAPVVVVVIGIFDPEDTRIPEQERLLTAGCVCLTLMQAAQAEGFGAQWITGWPSHDAEVDALLGLGGNERIVGFIHLGTPALHPPERPRPDPEKLLTDWSPS